ncbi:unnamed protein product [Trichobilharzia regenti]|nr:unnamed protein product [Trichobilharzia regenti]
MNFMTPNNNNNTNTPYSNYHQIPNPQTDFMAAAAAAMAVATAVAAASFQPVSSSSSSCDQLYSTISSSNNGGGGNTSVNQPIGGDFTSQCTRNILQHNNNNNNIDLNQGESVSPSSSYTNSNLPGSHLSVSGYPDIITRAYPLTTSSTHIMDQCQTSSYDSDLPSSPTLLNKATANNLLEREPAVTLNGRRCKISTIGVYLQINNSLVQI